MMTVAMTTVTTTAADATIPTVSVVDTRGVAMETRNAIVDKDVLNMVAVPVVDSAMVSPSDTSDQ